MLSTLVIGHSRINVIIKRKMKQVDLKYEFFMYYTIQHLLISLRKHTLAHLNILSMYEQIIYVKHIKVNITLHLRIIYHNTSNCFKKKGVIKLYIYTHTHIYMSYIYITMVSIFDTFV